MSIKGYNWEEGVVSKIEKYTITIGKKIINTAAVPQKELDILEEGDGVTVYYKVGDDTRATRIVLRSKRKIKVTEIKMSKTIEEVVKEANQFVPQEVLDRASEKDKVRLFETFTASANLAVKIYDIKATYEDTKKDSSDIIASIIEDTFAIAVVIDTNTNQIIKRNSITENTKTSPD